MTVGAKVKQTFANLKGIESTLRIYSVQSTNKEEVAVYKQELETLSSVIKDLEDRIKVLEFEEPQYKGD